MYLLIILWQSTSRAVCAIVAFDYDYLFYNVKYLLMYDNNLIKGYY
jgi:hypothetical protein